MPSKRKQDPSRKRAAAQKQRLEPAPERLRSHQLPNPSPFFLLPYEIQSQIIGCAIDEARWTSERRQRTTYNEVRNILRVCFRFRELAIPRLYHCLVWTDRDMSSNLEDTLKAHPEYVQHVREIEFYINDDCGYHEKVDDYLAEEAVHWAEFVLAKMRSSSSPERRLDRILLNFPISLMGYASEILDLFQPLQVEWKTRDVRYLLEGTSFAPLVRQPLDDWLSQVVRLHLSGFTVDPETVAGLSQLPNLTTLTLTGRPWLKNPPEPQPAPEALIRLLSAFETPTKFNKLLIADCNLETRRAVRTQLGICVSAISAWRFRPAQHGFLPGPLQNDGRMWHGCRVQRNCHTEEGWRLRPVSGCIPCPRCCALTTMESEERPEESSETPDSQADVADVARAHNPYQLSFKGPSGSGSSTIPLRYGLCDQHYDEIFGQTNDDGSGEVRKNILRRKALQCMRWLPNGFRGDEP